MRLETTNTVLLVIVLILLIYVGIYQPYQQKARMVSCFETATTLERARHYPVDDYEVTNEDISSFQKNVFACLSH